MTEFSQEHISMRSYETARNLFSFLGFCAGALIVLGAIVALMGGAAAQSFARNAGAVQVVLGAMPGIMMAAVGVIGQAMVQMGRASVDTAELAQQSLDVSRQHMELSKQLLEQGKTAAASFASLSVQRPAAAQDAQTGQDQGASYANQPRQAASIAEKESDAAAISAQPASTTKAITKEEQIPLVPISHDIIYQEGMFVVGG
ncbi:MAG: hypothetical protein ACSHXW_17305, partial [Yoonia sp.]